MSSRVLRRAAHACALALALTAFAAVLLDATPALVLEENETETEIEGVVCDVHVAVVPVIVSQRAFVRDMVHTIRETEVLRGRNVTFRIDRPPPA